jgi:outer membrane protein W
MLNQLFKLRTDFSVICWSLFLSIFSSGFVRQAYCENFCQPVQPCFSVQPLIEAKSGYFFFSGSEMRKVYNHGGWDVQLSSSYPVWDTTDKLSLNIYGSVEYFHCSGKSLQGDQKTSVWAIPVNIGLKPVIVISPEVQYYVTLGPRYFYIHQHNNSSFVDRNRSRNGIGFFVNTGFDFILWRHFLIDIFGEYSYAKTRFHPGKSGVFSRDVQISGFTFGVGLGYAF